MYNPDLVDSSSKIYLSNILQKCHGFRTNIYYYVLNIGIFIAFCLLFGTTLYYCYKHKPTEYEKQQKYLKEQEYILSKIKFYQSQYDNSQNDSTRITNLPFTYP